MPTATVASRRSAHARPDGLRDRPTGLPLDVRWRRERRAAVRVRPGQLELLARDPGRALDLGRDDVAQAPVDLEQVRDDQGHGRPVGALRDENAGTQRVVDPVRATDPCLVAIHREPERRRDVDDGSADLHRPASPRTTARPVRLASYAAVTISSAARPSAPVTAGGAPVRTAAMKSVYWRT